MFECSGYDIQQALEQIEDKFSQLVVEWSGDEQVQLSASFREDEEMPRYPVVLPKKTRRDVFDFCLRLV